MLKFNVKSLPPPFSPLLPKKSTDNEIMMLFQVADYCQFLECYKFECRSCGNTNLKRVVSLGYQPLANNLLNNKNEECELYPLELNYCPNCHNCQLSVSVDPKKMFSNYLYTSFFLLYNSEVVVSKKD